MSIKYIISSKYILSIKYIISIRRKPQGTEFRVLGLTRHLGSEVRCTFSCQGALDGLPMKPLDVGLGLIGFRV